MFVSKSSRISSTERIQIWIYERQLRGDAVFAVLKLENFRDKMAAVCDPSGTSAAEYTNDVFVTSGVKDTDLEVRHDA